MVVVEEKPGDQMRGSSDDPGRLCGVSGLEDEEGPGRKNPQNVVNRCVCCSHGHGLCPCYHGHCPSGTHSTAPAVANGEGVLRAQAFSFHLSCLFPLGLESYLCRFADSLQCMSRYGLNFIYSAQDPLSMLLELTSCISE